MGIAKAGPATPAPSHELDSPPWRRFESTLMATAEAIRRAYDERLAPLGLTLSVASLLAYIAEFGPVNQTRAAEHLNQGRAATGAQVDRLEAAGLVARQPDPDDRRAWLVEVTGRGQAVASTVGEIDEVLRRELRDGIPRADRQRLAGLLLRVQHNLAAGPGPGPGPAPRPASAETAAHRSTP